MTVGIVLYGPPTSGKSTVTETLHRLDPRYTLLRKLKAGNGRTDEYEQVSTKRLDELREAGRLAVETHRYGNIYAVDTADLDRMANAGQVPIVHIGGVADLHRLTARGSWLRVLLWVPREVCERRSRARGDDDTAERVETWDRALDDLTGKGLFDLRISTDRRSVDSVAREIAQAHTVMSGHAPAPAVRTGRGDAP
ncbi:guanylate kinase [Sinosporangium album]|uniref:Guanylate kinase n=1 Tax=Sinosporangium album TaxID=504805 RepID=A0A1G8FN00_9ACTN|nr:guanylate kinase [Sinosporangium album]SDH83514.1 guanylate kinase [Sinosporangium album]